MVIRFHCIYNQATISVARSSDIDNFNYIITLHRLSQIQKNLILICILEQKFSMQITETA